MIYLNNAATSYPKPPEVLEAVRMHLESPPSPLGGRGPIAAGRPRDTMWACRSALASLFNAEDERCISLTSGATFGLNMAINGLRLQGGHVVTSALEHSSVLRPLKALERKKALELSVVPCGMDGSLDLQSVKNSITSCTRAIVVSHASNVTGTITQVAQLGEIAYGAGLTLVVDASQSAGCVPIDVRSMGIDVLVFTGHKYLYGLEGIGGIYIREGLDVDPLLVGGTGVKSRSLYQAEERPACYESGTQNLVGIVSLAAGVQRILSVGIGELNRRRERQYSRLLEGLLSRPLVRVLGSRQYGTPIVSFNIHDIAPQAVAMLLYQDHGIHVRSGLLCAPLVHKYLGCAPDGAVRLSLSEFTTEAEIDNLLAALDGITAAVTSGKLNRLNEAGVLSCY